MSPALSIWWVWIAAALGLAILEIFAPGFLFLGFAIGAAFVGLALIGPLKWVSASVILLIFASLSLIAWLILRRIFALSKGQVKTFDHDIND